MAAELDTGLETLSDDLDELTQRGLVTPTSDQPPQLVPAPPERAVEMLILQKSEQFERIRSWATQQMSHYRDPDDGRGVGEYVQMVGGAEAVSERFQQLQSTARDDLLVFVKGPFLIPTDDQARTEQRLLDSGVRVRGLYERTALEDTEDLAQVTRLIKDGEQARVLASLPMKLAIADRSLALVPLDPTAPEGTSALLVHSCGLLEALVLLADSLWARAAPLGEHDTLPGQTELDEVDREVLGLLQAGLSDQSIGRRLGASERTISRRVRRMMDTAAAETRFQLGWRAAERGWLANSTRADDPPAAEQELAAVE